jgi:hypothetical protein
MRKAALFALAAAPFVAAGAGVVAARVIPFWPFRLIEIGYEPGDEASSCFLDTAVIEEHGAPDFETEVDGPLNPWHIAIYGETDACRRFDVFNLLGRAQCSVQAPARIVYRNEEMGQQAFLIPTIGEHRVRASRHGLSCRQMN